MILQNWTVRRAYVNDIVTVPLSFRKFLAGKLAAIGLLAVLFGVYCFGVTVVVGVLAGLPNMKIPALAIALLQMMGLAFWVYIVVLPIIVICSRKPGTFMGGSIIAFLAGYCILFFKSGLLR